MERTQFARLQEPEVGGRRLLEANPRRQLDQGDARPPAIRDLSKEAQVIEIQEGTWLPLACAEWKKPI